MSCGKDGELSSSWPSSSQISIGTPPSGMVLIDNLDWDGRDLLGVGLDETDDNIWVERRRELVFSAAALSANAWRVLSFAFSSLNSTLCFSCAITSSCC